MSANYVKEAAFALLAQRPNASHMPVPTAAHRGCSTALKLWIAAINGGVLAAINVTPAALGGSSAGLGVLMFDGASRREAVEYATLSPEHEDYLRVRSRTDEFPAPRPIYTLETD